MRHILWPLPALLLACGGSSDDNQPHGSTPPDGFTQPLATPTPDGSSTSGESPTPTPDEENTDGVTPTEGEQTQGEGSPQPGETDAPDLTPGGEGTPDLCEADDTPPVEIPANRKVIFRVINDTSDVIYLATKATGCTPWRVSDEAVDFPVELTGSCGCECDSPPSPVPDDLTLMLPDDSWDFKWDARVLNLYIERVHCFDTFCAEVERGVDQPLAPGTYFAQVAAYDYSPVFYPGAGGAYGVAPLCDHNLTLSATFTLPETGDVVVPIYARGGSSTNCSACF